MLTAASFCTHESSSTPSELSLADLVPHLSRILLRDVEGLYQIKSRLSRLSSCNPSTNPWSVAFLLSTRNMQVIPLGPVWLRTVRQQAISPWYYIRRSIELTFPLLTLYEIHADENFLKVSGQLSAEHVTLCDLSFRVGTFDSRCVQWMPNRAARRPSAWNCIATFHAWILRSVHSSTIFHRHATHLQQFEEDSLLLWWTKNSPCWFSSIVQNPNWHLKQIFNTYPLIQ